MADYLIQDTTLDAIADAINAKTGGSSAMTPAEMVTAIGSISGGGDDSVLASLVDRSITEIKNDSFTSIGICVFDSCSALTTVDLPNATSIGSRAFASCSALTTVNLPNATSIGSRAFVNCSALTTVNLPNATSIAKNAFEDISYNAVINLGAAEGKISGAPWGAPNGVTINYNVKG